MIRPLAQRLHQMQPSLRRSFQSSAATSLARMQLIGRLAAEPEVQATSTGKDLVRYSIGTSSGPSHNRQTSWFQVTSFDEGPRRDLLTGLAKGTLVFVEADSRMSAYEDAEGKRRYRLDLVQRQLDILSRPANREQEADPEITSAVASA